jgi:hypothetical protein
MERIEPRAEAEVAEGGPVDLWAKTEGKKKTGLTKESSEVEEEDVLDPTKVKAGIKRGRKESRVAAEEEG